MKQFLQKWAGPILIACTIAVVISTFIPALGHVKHDKLGHGLVFGGMCFFIPFTFWAPAKTFLTYGGIVALSGFLEILQSFVPGRTASFEDMIANIIGSTLGLLLGLILKKCVSTPATPDQEASPK